MSTNSEALSTAILWGLAAVVGASFLSDVWNEDWFAKLRASLYYAVPYNEVYVSGKRPYDCDFLTAPLGAKRCSYKREVDIQWFTLSSDTPPRPIQYGTIQSTPPTACSTDETAFDTRCYYISDLKPDEHPTRQWSPRVIELTWRKVQD